MVKIVEVCVVAPPPEALLDPTIPKSLPLTFFDLRWLRLPPVQRLFFYEISTPNRNRNTTSFFYSDVLPRLKKSLSLTLQHFLPLAGNLTWPESSDKPIINCVEGGTVSLTVTETDADFYRLSGKDGENLFEAVAYHPLIPNLAVSHEQAAVLALQVTLFPKSRGFSIGITTHHAVVDGKTSTDFMKFWAHVCRSLGGDGNIESSSSLTELKPFYDRTIIEDPDGLGATYAKQWQSLDGRPGNRSLMCWEVKQVPSDLVRGTFHLTRADIEKLRHLVNAHMAKKNERGDHDPEPIHVSTFALAYAYICVCLTKAEGITDDKVVIVFAIDCRSRLNPPIPATYFGNCIGAKFAVKEAKDLVAKDGFIVAVTGIGEAIKSLNNHGALEWEKDWVLKLTTPLGTSTRMYSTAGSPRFEVYNTDFGWGRPRKVDVVSIDRNGSIAFSDSRGGNGVEIGLVLKKQHMEAFVSVFAEGLES